MSNEIRLRTGRTKSILDNSIDSALLATEIYNKPRTTFRTQAYIVMMMIAWTCLFHAHFNRTIGDKYYHKAKNGRYEMIDGERKAWELGTCIKKYGELSEPEKANLIFFIGLRNKIEHRSVDKQEIDNIVFGECQALLYNYESLVSILFGEGYSLMAHLVHSLQYSRILVPEQRQATKRALSAEMKDVRNYIDTYRNGLSENTFNSQEYSIKLIQIPKISNTNRNDLAIEFVNWNVLSEEDKESYGKLTAIIKDKVITKEGINVGKLKANEVIEKVKQTSQIESFSTNDHANFYVVLNIRPPWRSEVDPFETNTKYCHYDELHGDYVYQEAWADLIVKILASKKITRQKIREVRKKGNKLDIRDFEGI